MNMKETVKHTNVVPHREDQSHASSEVLAHLRESSTLYKGSCSGVAVGWVNGVSGLVVAIRNAVVSNNLAILNVNAADFVECA